ncbi:hypothetical protein DENSPDRAFT_834650 [Dentipellis sp. KUC8613]|nr:hypothetical protein DENSPDRAFT_834650 [Dentipellis sp. KUC8613]
MPIATPEDLVNEFKQSGEFTRLRRDLLAQFQNSDGMSAFMARVEDVVQKRLDLEHNKLQFMPQDYVHRELLQELDRYPIVERAMGDFHAKTGAEMSSQIRKALQKALRKDRGVAEKDDGACAAVPVSTGDVRDADAGRL